MPIPIRNSWLQAHESGMARMLRGIEVSGQAVEGPTPRRQVQNANAKRTKVSGRPSRRKRRGERRAIRQRGGGKTARR
jgi:hypothetical protein